MKPKINLRLGVAGSETLLPQFEECLKSYMKFFDIGELLVYTTDNLLERIYEITKFKDDTYPNVKGLNKISIYDVDKFYKENYDKFPQSVKEVLNFSKDRPSKQHYSLPYLSSLFYMRMRIVMDYYLVAGRKPFIVSDIDVRIIENIKPILDWMKSDYILYNADYFDNSFVTHNPKIVEEYGEDFFKPIPQFNSGWMCVPKGVNLSIEEFFKTIRQEPDKWPTTMTAMAIEIIKNKIKTKLLPRELMVTKESGSEGKTLAHLGPYALGDIK